MKLIKETVEAVSYLTEESNGTKSMFIEGPFLVADEKNKNGRIYESKILAKEVNRYNEEYVSKNRAFGELGHPDTPSINLDRVSHLIVKLEQRENRFHGKAKILETPMGKIARSLIEGGASLGVSSRGMGSLVNRNGINYVQPDFYLATAADIVADPSAPGAFVEGIMEGKEWIWDNGIIKEADISEMRDNIRRANKKQLEERMVKQFENFIQKL